MTAPNPVLHNTFAIPWAHDEKAALQNEIVYIIKRVDFPNDGLPQDDHACGRARDNNPAIGFAPRDTLERDNAAHPDAASVRLANFDNSHLRIKARQQRQERWRQD